MATSKRVFTLRLEDDIFNKIGILATAEHRSMTNYIEAILLKHINESEAYSVCASRAAGDREQSHHV